MGQSVHSYWAQVKKCCDSPQIRCPGGLAIGCAGTRPDAEEAALQAVPSTPGHDCHMSICCSSLSSLAV